VLSVGGIAVACAGQGSGNGAQADLDSLVAAARGSVPPIDTVAPSGTPLPAPADDGAAGSGSDAGVGGADAPSSSAAAADQAGVGDAGSAPLDPSGVPAIDWGNVVDTTPDHPVTQFCITLARLLTHLSSTTSAVAFQQSAQALVADDTTLASLRQQTPSGGQGQVQLLLGAMQDVADGVPFTSDSIQRPLSQFGEWVRQYCTVSS
jgi:hypothetical protein